MGMLTEIHVADGSVFWIVSEFPGEMRDCKWMAVEERYKEARTPHGLIACWTAGHGYHTMAIAVWWMCEPV